MAEKLNQIRDLDEMAGRKSFIHSLSTSAKLLSTLLYLFAVVLCQRYEMIALIYLSAYPLFIAFVSEVKMSVILKPALLVLPFSFFLGLSNLFFDRSIILFLGAPVYAGWLSFLTLLLKTFLTVMTVLLFIATSGMNNIAATLSRMGVPDIFVFQIFMTYRYIQVLMEEGLRCVNAYHLRAPQQRGIAMKHFPIFIGQLLLRSFSRAGRVYASMKLRGFRGRLIGVRKEKLTLKDVYFIVAVLIFVVLIYLMV